MDKDLVLKYMEKALNLAEKVKGTTSPNPSVGAIIVKGAKIIGKGVTQRAGSDHAEIQALKNCTEDPEGSTLIVTLEPCSFYGKTPPCVEAIKESKIKEVYIATFDQNEKVSGKGFQMLKDAGIHTECSFLEDKAKELNNDFFKWVKTGLPYVTVKYAMTLDGKMATSAHSSKWISGEESRADSHNLRFQNDAILVGSNTVKFDNPTLSCRVKNKIKYPLRVVVESNNKLDNNYTVIKDDHPTLIAVPQSSNVLSYYDELLKSNTHKAVLPIKTNENNVNLANLLKHLGDFQITSVLVEGGSQVFYSMYQDNLIDKVIAYIAPKIVTGNDGIIPFTGKGLEDISQAMELHNVKYEQLGEDIKISGYTSLKK